MDRLGNPELDERCWDIGNANDCRSTIATALAEKPFDEEALHRCVDCYVGAARIAGRSPSDVIVAVTELVERTDIAPASVRHALIRHVIPWCVEAYFGRIGGVHDRSAESHDPNSRRRGHDRPEGLHRPAALRHWAQMLEGFGNGQEQYAPQPRQRALRSGSRSQARR